MTDTVPNHRQADPRVLDVFVNRWSPRSYDGSAMPQEDLEVILEAGGLAPSAYNIQPWTFVYAHRDTEDWNTLFGLLNEFNQIWAKDAAVLLFPISDSKSRQPGKEPQDNRSHTFDTGAAWAMLALQASHMGWDAHGMNGVHFDKAREVLGVPEDHRVECGIAIGKRAPADRLPEALAEREEISGRKPVAEIMREGTFS